MHTGHLLRLYHTRFAEFCKGVLAVRAEKHRKKEKSDFEVWEALSGGSGAASENGNRKRTGFSVNQKYFNRKTGGFIVSQW